jgi:hypothetical protein
MVPPSSKAPLMDHVIGPAEAEAAKQTMAPTTLRIVELERDTSTLLLN